MKRTLVISSLAVLVTLLAPLSLAVSPVNGKFPHHPLPGIDRYISVFITPHELSGSASIRPGTYLMDEPLRLQVTSNDPGWYMHIHAMGLKSHDDEINAEDIHVLLKQGAVALDQPQPVVQGGDVGQTTIEALIELREFAAPVNRQLRHSLRDSPPV